MNIFNVCNILYYISYDVFLISINNKTIPTPEKLKMIVKFKIKNITAHKIIILLFK